MRYTDLSPQQLVALSIAPCKRATMEAERVAAKTAKFAMDKSIDDKAKIARMEAALAEPADLGRFMAKRGRRKSAATPAPKRQRKSDPKRPVKRPARKRMNPALEPLDHFSSDSAQPDTSEPFVPAHEAEQFAPPPVLVKGEEEWVVDRITGEMEVESENEMGGFEIVKKYEVHWKGGEVTWEALEVVQDCQALDAYEKRRETKMGKRVVV